MSIFAVHPNGTVTIRVFNAAETTILKSNGNTAQSLVASYQRAGYTSIVVTER